MLPSLITRRSNFPVCVKSPGTTLTTLRGCRKETDGLKAKLTGRNICKDAQNDDNASRLRGVTAQYWFLTLEDILSHHDSKDGPTAFAGLVPTTVRLGLSRSVITGTNLSIT